MKRFSLRKLPPLGRLSRRLLHIQMITVIICAICLLSSYLWDAAEHQVYAAWYYSQMVEYLLAGFVISAASVCLADRLERESE